MENRSGSGLATTNMRASMSMHSGRRSMSHLSCGIPLNSQSYRKIMMVQLSVKNSGPNFFVCRSKFTAKIMANQLLTKLHGKGPFCIPTVYKRSN